eukprot:5087647-Amphidinium_carterae.1
MLGLYCQGFRRANGMSWRPGPLGPRVSLRRLLCKPPYSTYLCHCRFRWPPSTGLLLLVQHFMKYVQIEGDWSWELAFEGIELLRDLTNFWSMSRVKKAQKSTQQHILANQNHYMPYLKQTWSMMLIWIS